MEYEKAKKEDLIFDEKSSRYKLYKYKTINTGTIDGIPIEIQVTTDKIYDQDDITIPDFTICNSPDKGLVMIMSPEFLNLPEHIMQIFLDHSSICLEIIMYQGYRSTNDFDEKHRLKIEHIADLELIDRHGLKNIEKFLKYLCETYPNVATFGERLSPFME